MLDSVGEKTLVADRAHIDQRTVDAPGKEFLSQTCQRRRFGSAEHVGRNREIELIDQVAFQQGSKQRWPAFARKPSHVVFAAQSSQHSGKIDLVGFSEMQSGFLFERSLSLLWHSRRGENQDWRSSGLENVQLAVDPAFV